MISSLFSTVHFIDIDIIRLVKPKIGLRGGGENFHKDGEISFYRVTFQNGKVCYFKVLEASNARLLV